MFNSTAVCRTVSRLLAGTDGNPAYGGDKHGAGIIPHQITGEHFTELFVGKGFGTALKNTLFTKWNLMGTRLPIILSCMLVNIPLVIWFMVSFFEELPEEVEESGNLHAFLYVCMEVDFAVQQFIRRQLEELYPADR